MLPFKATKRLGRMVSLPAGGLLFLCAFMPAVRGCQEAPVYPYHEATSALSGVPLGFPHLFGLLCVIAAALLLNREARRVTVFGNLFWGVTTLLSLSLGYGLTRGALENASTGQRVCLLLLPPFLFLLYKLIRRRDASQEAPFVGRVIWIGGAMSTLWYTHWLILANPLYGLYLSFVSSLLLVLGGVISERAED